MVYTDPFVYKYTVNHPSDVQNGCSHIYADNKETTSSMQIHAEPFSVDKIDALFAEQTPMTIGKKEEIQTGDAFIRCAVDGTVRDYQIKITKVDLFCKEVNKGIVLEVTDPELLDLTGGIVQGMSGSPIIQNGKLVGAVTHVFVQDATKGYGIFIENMLKNIE